ncbi:uncharacterized protein F5891DRAFT_958756 [Suillus fuscotomentosus]|uniref:DUF6830 domain-containing protein n=1 Tax=Suillus fuscotomentosus TaxID=1912939 RepID=A0AAD4HHH8_9AGAM|nr:uncharacterized protein F5891DRAFT_958822 [Suillus fuscotomentosus]XP_041221958.1 uncharacterized protein F5891DRAFT_958756 [Suillus fuscotomentosus]KAG1896381.1 hypothetical protein F5891DRAFT_958822 [Suillus fuscotomentosus]KAG1896382.1 hypothetical protein F5891DRAFT_958756 [Suillus fuscotomentosus]
MLDKLEDDEYAYRRKENTYYPFHDEAEWQLGKFLVENLTQTQIAKFLKLTWFDTRERPSFTSKDQLIGWMDTLPCFTEWKVSQIAFTGYKTSQPIELIWRDVLDVVKQLFSDPTFANHMTFDPHVVQAGDQREYGDYMSADMAWKIQVYLLSDHLPMGATQVPIILGSDKTPVTRVTGGLEMHPVFITIGNIDSEVRSKATLRAWRCVGYMPIVKFKVHPDYQTILQARLWHKCMDLILANLKAAAAEGCFMSDPFRYIRYVFTPLIAHFQKAAKAVYLSGVHMPFWRDWKYACPSVFLAAEILHTCHKFFFDHPLNWVKEAVGKHELNARFAIQHKRVGTRHFAKGVTHIKQMTGREHRDIQRTIVASIAGATPPRFIRAIRALIDFIYLAQNPVHSPDSLKSMAQALADFHSFKDAIVDAEARRGKNGAKEDFFIPKLELLQSFCGTVERLGSLMQFSADVTERLLITHCKDLFSRTSRQSKDFALQCVRILNRQEAMEIFDLFALLHSCGASLVNAIHAEDEDVITTNPALSWVSRVLPDEAKSVHGPRPVRNHFLKGILSGDALTAFQLNVTPDYKSLSPVEIRTKYSLPDFDIMLTDFMHRSSQSMGEHSLWDSKYGRLSTWNKFRLQLRSAFQPRIIMPSRVIQAYPPSEDFPFGNCDTVLIETMRDDGQTSSRVAQVRLVFQPIIRRGSNLDLPTYLSTPLLYVQYFHFIASPDEQPELSMWTVERSYVQDNTDNRYRQGAVVQITDVTHAIELIPCFGEKVASDISSATCLERHKRFFLNNFADKESYHTFSTEFA